MLKVCSLCGKRVSKHTNAMNTQGWAHDDNEDYRTCLKRWLAANPHKGDDAYFQTYIGVNPSNFQRLELQKPSFRQIKVWQQ